jgi:DNA polymerase-4
LGVHVSGFQSDDLRQLSLFDKKDVDKLRALDSTVDKIREKYGMRAIIRGSFTNGNINAVQGGTNDSDFIMMGGYQ